MSSAALVLAVSPASAATIEAVFEGTVVNGFETGGVFLPPRSSFSGQSFVASLVYDTSIGTEVRISDTATLSGGSAIGGTPSPVLSAQLTINGVTEVIPTDRFGEISVGGGIFQLRTAGTLSSLDFSVLDPAFVNPFGVNPFFGSNLDVTGTFAPTNFTLSNFFVRSGLPTQVIGGMLVNRLTLSLLTVAPPPPPPPPPQPPEVSVIPLPASALLLLAGLGALGVMRRRT